MSFFYLLAVLVVLGAVALFIATKLARRIRSRSWANATRLILFLALLPLPLVDEIVGKWQFERLCRENAEIKIDRATAAGRTVYYQSQPASDVSGTWVPVRRLPQRFVDATTEELVVSYDLLRARGGRFARLFGLSDSGAAPLLFEGSCAPKNRPASIETFKPLGINYIERPRK
jgi:hypothetical protein